MFEEYGLDHKINREDLMMVPAPTPVGIWNPIPHNTLLETTERALDARGYEMTHETHILTKDGARYFGIIALAPLDDDVDYTTILGLRNSHDKTFGAQLVVGDGVFVCSNLSFSGEVKIGRKHTTHIRDDLPQLIAQALDRIPQMRRSQQERFDSYRAAQLTPEEVDSILMEAMRRGIVPSSKLRPIWDEFDNPGHKEFLAGDLTVWRLFNAFTENMKRSITTLPQTTQKLQSLLDDNCRRWTL